MLWLDTKRGSKEISLLKRLFHWIYIWNIEILFGPLQDWTTEQKRAWNEHEDYTFSNGVDPMCNSENQIGNVISSIFYPITIKRR